MEDDIFTLSAKWFDNYKCKSILNKEVIFSNHMCEMQKKTLGMFEWKGLPDTIPQDRLELYIQQKGYAFITKVKGDYYVFFGGLGGAPNEYYIPTLGVIANPYLRFNASLKIGEECVIIPNDSFFQSVNVFNSKYAKLLTENEITMNVFDINTRIPAFITTSTDKEKKDAEAYVEKIYNGDLAIFGGNQFTEGLKTVPYSQSGITQGLKDCIEYEQYLIGSWHNEMGMTASFNMKREALNSSETDMNEGALLTIPQDMLRARKRACEQINKIFPELNITVEFANAWAIKQNEQDYAEANPEENKEEQKEEVQNEV